jgi:hypothetical protein
MRGMSNQRSRLSCSPKNAAFVFSYDLATLPGAHAECARDAAAARSLFQLAVCEAALSELPELPAHPVDVETELNRSRTFDSLASRCSLAFKTVEAWSRGTTHTPSSSAMTKSPGWITLPPKTTGTLTEPNVSSPSLARGPPSTRPGSAFLSDLGHPARRHRSQGRERRGPSTSTQAARQNNPHQSSTSAPQPGCHLRSTAQPRRGSSNCLPAEDSPSPRYL